MTRPQKTILHRITGYPLAGMVVILSWLPWRVMYGASSMLAFLMASVIRYRRKVIMENLRNSFPEKEEKALQKIRHDFYRHLADVIVETIKTLNMSERQMKQRSRFTPEANAILRQSEQEGKPMMALLGHLGNWEWVPPPVTLQTNFQVITAYRPLRNKIMDKLLRRIRGRFVHDLVPKSQIGRALLRHKKSRKPLIAGLIADQNPGPLAGLRTTFLSQDTLIYSGPDKLARKMKMPVYFVASRKEKRGQYLIHVSLLAEKPEELPEGEIARLFMKALEKEIEKSPALYLWSHRRWKHKPSAQTILTA
ncbi:MAG: lysophospholipid acyltransferase family protein [Bacteroidales bacterium]